MTHRSFLLPSIWAIFLIACGETNLNKTDSEGSDQTDLIPEEIDTGGSANDADLNSGSEIIAGEGIGPATLGSTYGTLVDEFGAPDSSFEYFRVVFAVWLDLGIEVVFSTGEDGVLDNDSLIVSVGTKLPSGYKGEVVPGMTRAEAEAIVGPCMDVVDEVHCYHPVGLYLGFGADRVVQSVAVHPAYTVRSAPPEMTLSVGGE